MTKTSYKNPWIYEVEGGWGEEDDKNSIALEIYKYRILNKVYYKNKMIQHQQKPTKLC